MKATAPVNANDNSKLGFIVFFQHFFASIFFWFYATQTWRTDNVNANNNKTTTTIN